MTWEDSTQQEQRYQSVSAVTMDFHALYPTQDLLGPCSIRSDGFSIHQEQRELRGMLLSSAVEEETARLGCSPGTMQSVTGSQAECGVILHLSELPKVFTTHFPQPRALGMGDAEQHVGWAGRW